MLIELIQDAQWRQVVESGVNKETLQALDEFLDTEQQKGRVLPPKSQWFRAINELAFDQVKVVILGQDPYHGIGQAHGLSFSVAAQQKIPPSLRNIFKELKTDCQIENQSGDLTPWHQQGVLLLNATLTVAEGNAGSHQKRGWEILTDALIRALALREKPCVFLLWGAYASAKQDLITSPQHLVLTAPHPSPLSAHKGWFGCRHFSKTNAFLLTQGQAPIDWKTSAESQQSFSF